MTEQIHIPSLVFGSIIEGQYMGRWYKVRTLRKNRVGIEIEYLEGPLSGRIDYKSNQTLIETEKFRKWNV